MSMSTYLSTFLIESLNHPLLPNVPFAFKVSVVFPTLVSSRTLLSSSRTLLSSDKTMPAKKRKKNTLDVEIIPKLKNPHDITNCGYQIEVPGSYWNYRGTVKADEKKSIYKCNVIGFRELYRPTPGDPFEPHFLLREMGTSGQGSLEDCSLEGTVFCMKNPLPFLTFFYASNPELDPRTKEKASPITLHDD